MVDPITAVAAGGAALSALGGIFGLSSKKKAEREQNRRISQLMTQTKDLRNIQKVEIKNQQLQNTQRNINVMGASGFEMSSFGRLNTWLEEKNMRDLQLYDQETNLMLAEINAGRPISQSSFAQGLNIASQTFQTFASLGGFKG